MDLKQITENPLYIKYQYYLLPLLAISVGIGLLIYIFKQEIPNAMQTQKKLEKAQSQSLMLSQKIGILEQVDEERYRQNINTVLSAVPADKDAPSAIGQIIYLVNASQLKLNSIGVSEVKTEQESYNIKLEVEGEIASLKDFADKLKTSPRIMKINNLEFSKNRGEEVSANIELLTYFQPIVSSIGSTDQPISPVTEDEIEIIKQINNYSRTVPTITSENVTGAKGKSDPFE